MSKSSVEVERVSQIHTSYIIAGTRTYFSASACFIQTDIYYKCFMYLLKAGIIKVSKNYLLLVKAHIPQSMKMFSYPVIQYTLSQSASLIEYKSGSQTFGVRTTIQKP